MIPKYLNLRTLLYYLPAFTEAQSLDPVIVVASIATATFWVLWVNPEVALVYLTWILVCWPAIPRPTPPAPLWPWVLRIWAFLASSMPTPQLLQTLRSRRTRIHLTTQSTNKHRNNMSVPIHTTFIYSAILLFLLYVYSTVPYTPETEIKKMCQPIEKSHLLYHQQVCHP